MTDKASADNAIANLDGFNVKGQRMRVEVRIWWQLEQIIWVCKELHRNLSLSLIHSYAVPIGRIFTVLKVPSHLKCHKLTFPQMDQSLLPTSGFSCHRPIVGTGECFFYIYIVLTVHARSFLLVAIKMFSFENHFVPMFITGCGLVFGDILIWWKVNSLSWQWRSVACVHDFFF